MCVCVHVLECAECIGINRPGAGHSVAVFICIILR